MLQLVLGGSGSGKTTLLYHRIRARAEAGQKSILLVPEQFTSSTEGTLYHILGDSLSAYVESYSFTSLAEALLRRYGGAAVETLSEAGRALLVRRAADSLLDKVVYYNRQRRSAAFCEKAAQTIEELKSAGITPDQLAAYARLPGADREKLEELSLIYGSYEAQLAQTAMDPGDRQQLAAQMLDASFFAGRAVYMDEFDTFNAPKRALLAAMLPVADAAFPGVMLGQAIGRWGNFFNMEAFGTNTTLPWGMTSDTISAYLSRHQAALAAQGIMVDPTLPVHPTFLYESLWNLIGVAILLLWLFPRRSYDGQITLGYTAWYGLGRFFVEGLRTDSLMWGSVRVSQALGGVLFIVAAGLMLFIFLRGRKPMTLEYIEGQKKPRFTLGRYVDTKESRARIAALDAKLAEKKNGKEPTQPEQKEEPHEREDH